MSAVDALLEDQEYLDEEFVKLTPIAQAVVNWQMKWHKEAHKHQIEPMGDWWNVWLMLAGRGAGKTRAAAEAIGWWAWNEPAIGMPSMRSGAPIPLGVSRMSIGHGGRSGGSPARATYWIRRISS